MPAGLQVMTFYNQDLGGATAVALTPGTGDTGTFFNVPQGSQAYIAEVWGVDSATKAEIYLTASRFHDQVFGIRYVVPAGSSLAPASRVVCVDPAGVDQPIFPSDVLTVSAVGADNDIVGVTLVLYYADIPGVAARLISAAECRTRGGNKVGIKTTLTPGAGNWGASVALNASDNRLHANTDYAVIGMNSMLPLTAVGLSGIDTGNLRTGGPVLADGDHDATLWYDLAEAYDAQLIPVINSNNAGSTFLQAAATVTTASEVDVLLVELDRQIGT
jgi:hypothetical protein